MITIYFVDYCGDEGEAQAFYNEDNSLLHYWWSNDGNWRSEYFDPLLKALGIKVKSAYRTRPELENKFEEYLKENH